MRYFIVKEKGTEVDTGRVRVFATTLKKQFNNFFYLKKCNKWLQNYCISEIVYLFLGRLFLCLFTHHRL